MELPIRERRISVRNDPAFLLAVLYTVGFYGFVFVLLLKSLTPENEKLISQLLPVLSMIQGGIVQYFYNKSTQIQHEKKDETINKLASTAATTANTAAVALTAPPIVPSQVPDVNIKANNVDTHEDKKGS